MKNRNVLMTLVVIALLMGFASVAAASGELYILMYGDEGFYNWYRACAEDFMKANPDITVNVEQVSGGDKFLDKLYAMVAGGNPPDIVSGMMRWAAGWYEEGFVADLTPFVEKDPEFEGDAFIAAFLDHWTYKGHLLGVPINPDAAFLGYNTTLFSEVGVVSPNVLYEQGKWTWDTFLDTAKKGTIDENGDGTPDSWGYVPHMGGTWVWHPGPFSFVYENGGRLIDVMENKAVFDSAEAISALQWWADLGNVHKVARSGAGLLARGNVMMETMPSFRFRQAYDGGVAAGASVNPAPVGRDPVHILLGPGNVILKSGREKLAWEFAKFCASHENMIKLTELSMRLPARLSSMMVVLEELVSEYTVDSHMIQECFAYSDSLPYNEKWGQVVPVFTEMLLRLWRDEAPAASLVPQYVDQIDAILQE